MASLSLFCKRRAASSIFILAVSLLLTACAERTLHKPPRARPVPEPVTTEALVKRLDFSGLSTVRSPVRFGIRHAGEPRGVYSGILTYSHPDRLRLKVMGPFGFTYMEMLFDSGILQSFIPSRGLLYSGAVPLERLLPEREAIEKHRKVLVREDEAYSLHLYSGVDNQDLKAKYFFSTSDLSWKGVELYSDGEMQLRAEIQRMEEDFPSHLIIHVGETSFSLELKDIKMNSVVGDDYFRPLTASRVIPLRYFLDRYLPSLHSNP